MKWTIMHRRTNPVRPINVFVSSNYDGDEEWGMGIGEGGSERGGEATGGEDVTTKKVYRSTAIDAVT